jgi:hypothetical protein
MVFGWIAALINLAGSAGYYVDGTANGNGSIGSPFRTIQQAAAVAQSGRVVRMSGAGLDISAPGPQMVRITNIAGAVVTTFTGNGPQEYRWPAESISSGVYIVEAQTPTQRIVKRVGAI